MRYPKLILQSVAGILVSSALSCRKEIKMPTTDASNIIAPALNNIK